MTDTWHETISEKEKLEYKIYKLEEEVERLKKELAEAIEQQYKNSFDIQMQAERGAKYAQKENARLREALEVILDATQKDEPCVLAIKSVAYMALKEKEE